MNTDAKIALLRGINVGGTGKVPMADLRTLMGGSGAADVRTYIQSGNAVFRGDVSADKIGEAIEAKFGFRPRVLVMDGSDLVRAAAANPFEFDEAKEMHLYFCETQPDIDPTDLAADATSSAQARPACPGRTFLWSAQVWAWSLRWVPGALQPGEGWLW